MAYTIGSDKGKKKAEEMKAGESWSNPADGSTWKKNNDGSVSVTHQGVTTNNAYKPSSTPSGNSQYSTGNNTDYGTLGKQQMASGADWKTVLGTYNARNNKALTTEGLGQYANDALQQEMWDYITANMSNPNAVSDYMSGFNDVYSEEKPTYNAKYDAQMEAMLNKILNREDFSYDAQSDPLYQQYEAMYRREGDRAMRDTMAEAAASAGGMNSYAITAAQQANNYYNAQLGDKIPELYQLAYEMYLQDKESQVQDLGLLQSMDATQYNRYRDTMSDYYNDKNFAYGLYSDAVQQGNWDKNFNYNQAINERDFSYGSAQDTITNNWKGKEWDNYTAQQKLENERYDAQWNNTLSQQELEKQRYDQEIARESVLNLLEMGQMPDAALLEAAGMDSAYANAYLKGVQSQMASKSSGGSSSSSSSSKKKKVDDDGDDDPVVYTPKSPAKLNDGSVEGLGIGMVNDATLKEIAMKGGLTTDEKGGVYWADGWNKDNWQERVKPPFSNLATDILMNGLYNL